MVWGAGDGAEIFIDSVACGATFTACLTEDGKVYTWGCGDHGVLGHNDTKDQVLPSLLPSYLLSSPLSALCYAEGKGRA